MGYALITLAIGSFPYAEISHPSMRAYAERIGCDFIAITGDAPDKVSAHSRKLEIANHLMTYDRIIYVDGDVMINKNCPDLFAEVPPDKIGATVEEEPFFRERSRFLRDACKLYDVTIDEEQLSHERWFNSGVMVVSRCHAPMFGVAEGVKIQRCNGFVDQAFLNAMRIRCGVSLHDLGLGNNYIASVMFSNHRQLSPFQAGMFHATGALHPHSLRMEYMRQFNRISNALGSKQSTRNRLGRFVRIIDRFFFLKVAMKCRKNPMKRWVMSPIASMVLSMLLVSHRFLRL